MAVVVATMMPLQTLTTTKPAIRASLKQGELAIRASLTQGELLDPAHDDAVPLLQDCDEARVIKIGNVELVMSDTDSAITSTSRTNGNNSYARQALVRLLSVPYDSGRLLMLSL